MTATYPKARNTKKWPDANHKDDLIDFPFLFIKTAIHGTRKKTTESDSILKALNLLIFRLKKIRPVLDTFLWSIYGDR
jgi:hypothetical protein